MRIAKKLASPSLAEHLSGLQELRALAVADNLAAVSMACELALELENVSGLPNREKAGRLRAVLRHLAINPKTVEALVEQARSLSAALCNEIAAVLPPNDRRRLAATNRDPVPNAADKTGFGGPATAGSDVETFGDGLDFREGSSDQSRFEGASVLILARQTDQTANKALLRNFGYSSFVFDSLDQVTTDLASCRDVCACLVDGSFLTGSTEDEQTELFRTLGEHSTFMWIRVEDRGLLLDHDRLRECVRFVQRSPIAAETVSIQETGFLRDKEIGDISIARNRLLTYRDSPLVVDDLEGDEARILTAAISQYVYQQGGKAREKIGSLKVKSFAAGKSGAKTLLIRAANHQVVAKVDRKSVTLDEMNRFVAYIKKSDDRLRPMVYFHGMVGVIVFSLVSDLAVPEKPAPMLSEHLESLWNDEVFASKVFERRARVREMSQALRATALQLYNINKHHPIDGSHSPIDVGLEFVRGLHHRGIAWNLPEGSLDALAKAEAKYRALCGEGVIHGDFHLKNVVVRGGRDTYLIDYAAAGPGHPAMDLVRFELALYLDFFRQVSELDVCSDLQRRLSLGASTDDLRAVFPELFQPAINDACLDGCVVAREHAILAAREHRGGEEDYLAVKFVLAWQRLLLVGTQTALVRSIIEVLAPLINAWNVTPLEQENVVGFVVLDSRASVTSDSPKSDVS